MIRALVLVCLFQTFVCGAFAAKKPKCPRGTHLAQKVLDKAHVLYCLKSVIACPTADGVEMVSRDDGGKKSCEVAEGPMFYDNADGSHMVVPYVDGFVEGAVITTSSQGKRLLEEHYKHGVKEGKQSVWYVSNGKHRSVEHYHNGLRDGQSKQWFESGALMAQGVYHGGKREGIFVNWYKNGKKRSEVNYSFGLWDGKYVEYYSNGNKACERTFQGGVLEGPYTIWYRSGKKESERNYEFGKLSGNFVDWDEQGNRISERIFQAGTLVKTVVQASQSSLRALASDGVAQGIIRQCEKSQNCLRVDLDGNGYLDYVAADPRDATHARVVLMRAEYPIQDLEIGEFPLQIYSERPEEGQFDEPATPREGLVTLSSGNTSHVYLYDLDKENFSVTEIANADQY